MPKVKPELRHREEEALTLDAQVAAQLKALVPVVAEEPPLAAVFAPAIAPPLDVEAAKARVRAMFQQDAPPPPAPVPAPEPFVVDEPLAMPDGTATERLRKETLADLIAQGWKHSEAVTVANRVKELLDEDEDQSVPYALAIATEEHIDRVNAARQLERSRVRTTSDPPPPPDEDDEPEPGSEIPSSVGTGLTGYGEPNDELMQIVHNLERDAARLRKLFGLEGVKKTRKKANG